MEMAHYKKTDLYTAAKMHDKKRITEKVMWYTYINLHILWNK